PAIYRLGVEAAGVGAEECCVIGDSFGKDIVPAMSLGCQTVWLKGKTWERETVDESVPTHIITSLTELANIF
ncbi:MAG: HAD hydrolase-like protein, partial [Bacteroidaceae bacterium]|nr:HAD hydrolase-like protein [Bacteroidaceae bacterium]